MHLAFLDARYFHVLYEAYSRVLLHYDIFDDEEGNKNIGALLHSFN
jgi:hypothetical protein